MGGVRGERREEEGEEVGGVMRVCGWGRRVDGGRESRKGEGGGGEELEGKWKGNEKWERKWK